MLRIDDGVMRHMATRRIQGSPVRPVAVGRAGAQDAVIASDVEEEEEGDGRQHQPRRSRRQPDARSRAPAHTVAEPPVCTLRLAVNTRRKDESGQWTDKPNYFDVTVWGKQGENCAQYLAKGRPVAIDGRLDWREWEAQDGTKRQAVEIVAESVQFLGSRQDGESALACRQVATAGAQPAASADFRVPTDDDIPF